MTGPGSPPPARGRGTLTAGSLLALLWFSAMFFVAFPAGVLWWSGTPLWPPPPGANRWVGGAVLGVAQLLLIGPVRDFIVEGRGTQAPIAPPGFLVRVGLYRRVRNPMYLLYLVIVLGEAILYRSPALLVYAAAFFALEHAYVVGVEEKQLRRRFGADYAAYCARVGRWLPRRNRTG